ncbi:MAG: hypothetical protein J5787_05070 [Alphaproteobacteria bacterium]|nr:hypothetical protein [Alphaproteobacteria bacterium]
MKNTDEQSFYERSKEYAIEKLAKEHYIDKEKCSPEEAKEKAKQRIEALIKPAVIYDIRHSETTLEGIYKRLLISCQNRQQMPNVIKFNKNEKEFSDILKSFNPFEVSKETEEKLYVKFTSIPKFNVNTRHHKNWENFAKSVLDSAKFVSRFKKVEDFKKMIENLDAHFQGSLVLPRLISGEIRGIGLALACDFLKEIGYVEYPKPDVHIKDIIGQLFFKKTKNDKPITDEEAIFKVREIANNANVSAFAVDKILWLIGSGKYYGVNGIEGDIEISADRQEFINEIKKESPFYLYTSRIDAFVL